MDEALASEWTASEDRASTDDGTCDADGIDGDGGGDDDRLGGRCGVAFVRLVLCCHAKFSHTRRRRRERLQVKNG